MTIDMPISRGGNGAPLPHRRALAATALGVVASHAALLLSWSPAAEPLSSAVRSATPVPVRSVQVLAVAAAQDMATPATATAARSGAAARQAATPPSRDVEPRMPESAPARANSIVPKPRRADDVRVPIDAAPTTTVASGAAQRLAADAGSAPAPVYATRPPAAAALHYELRRGAATGSAVLDWRHDQTRYELALVGTIAGAEALGWLGRGGFDEAGLAPERFVVRRRGRDLLAANFQRGPGSDEVAAGGSSGRVTFSGPAVEWPLWPGVQDRVSWLLQLASILEAEPALGREGSRIVLWVVGARGDAGRWALEARAPEALELPAGRVERALPFVREAQHAHDLDVEVWVDPERGHLPVRLRLSARPSGEVTEFLLRTAAAR